MTSMSFLSFFTLQTQCCRVIAAIVSSDSAASLTGYAASTATAKTNRKLLAQKQVSTMGQHSRNFLWRNYVGDFRLVEFALHVRHLKYSKEQKK